MIVVTAPTGGIGRQVVQNLLAEGAAVRVVARDPARLPAGVARQTEIVRGSHRDPDVLAEAFAGADAVFWPAPAAATRDSAAVAARLLRDGSWTGFEEVPVLGPEDLSYDQMAAIISDVLGKPVHYQQIPGEAYKANMMRFSSEPMAQGLLDM